MLAPWRKPFDSLDLSATAQLLNGDHSEEHYGKLAQGQPAQVFQWEVFASPSCYMFLINIDEVKFLVWICDWLF